MRPLRLLAGIALLLSFATNSAALPDAATLMERSRQTTLLRGAQIDFTFELLSASGSVRMRKLASLFRTDTKGDTARLARYEFPADAKGLATLLVEHRDRDNELWVYVPAVKKLRRLVADNERDSFMGTVLSHGDVLGYKTAQWAHEIVGEETIDGRPCWHVVSKPASDAVKRASGYEHREAWVDQESSVTLKTSAWDESGRLQKTVNYRQLQPVSQQPGAWIAKEIEARDLVSGATTKIRVDRFDYQPNLSAEQLAPSALEEES